MIQRIQSVYLFLAAVAISTTYFFPLAEAIGSGDSLVLYTYKLISLVPDQVSTFPAYFIWPMFGTCIVLFMLSLASIFAFKNRNQQLNFIRVSIILLLALIALFFFYYVPEIEAVSGALVDYNKIGASLPIVSLLFLILAYRGIISDIKLLKSADRLR